MKEPSINIIWTTKNKKYGFEGLIPKVYKNEGTHPTIPDDIIKEIISLKEELPTRSAKKIITLMELVKHFTWSGQITSLYNYGSHYEMRIESLSGITVLFGKISMGTFACMPDFSAGCHLAELDNEFYSKQNLWGLLILLMLLLWPEPSVLQQSNLLALIPTRLISSEIEFP